MEEHQEMLECVFVKYNYYSTQHVLIVEVTVVATRVAVTKNTNPYYLSS